MQIKIGDLVYRKSHRAFEARHNNEIWVATDICSCDGRVRIMNIHSQDTILTCKPHMLTKIDTDKN